jgi:hypothetical protein
MSFCKTIGTFIRMCFGGCQAGAARGVRCAALRPQTALRGRVSELSLGFLRLNSPDAARTRAARPPRLWRRRVADTTASATAPQAPCRFRSGTADARGRARPVAVLPCGRVTAAVALDVPGCGPAGHRGLRLPTESILALLPPRPSFRSLSALLLSLLLMKVTDLQSLANTRHNTSQKTG